MFLNFYALFSQINLGERDRMIEIVELKARISPYLMSNVDNTYRET